MTRSELDTMLRTLDCEVYYNHTTSKDIVNLPFIVYLDNNSNNIFSDNETYYEVVNYTIILHTTDPNDSLIGSIKELLTTYHIPYEFDGTDWNNDLLFYQIQFSIQQ